MKFWTRINSRWTREQLASWSSIFKTLYILFPVIIYYLAGDITEVILWVLLNSVLTGASEETMQVMSQLNGTIQGMIYAIGLLVSILFFRKAAMNEITLAFEDDEKKQKLSAGKVLLLILIALVSSIGLNYLMAVTGFTSSSETYREIQNAQYSVNFVSGLIIYGICSPLVEELMFRGLIYNRMKRIFPLAVSMVVSSLLFGLFHGNMVQGVYATIMGGVMVLCYEKFKSFLAPLIVHITANLGVYILSYTTFGKMLFGNLVN